MRRIEAAQGHCTAPPSRVEDNLSRILAQRASDLARRLREDGLAASGSPPGCNRGVAHQRPNTLWVRSACTNPRQQFGQLVDLFLGVLPPQAHPDRSPGVKVRQAHGAQDVAGLLLAGAAGAAVETQTPCSPGAAAGPRPPGLGKHNRLVLGRRGEAAPAIRNPGPGQEFPFEPIPPFPRPVAFPRAAPWPVPRRRRG